MFFPNMAFAMEEDRSAAGNPTKILTGLPNEVLLNTMVHVPTPDLLSLYINSKGNTANKTLFEMARCELINRGCLVTFSMYTMTQDDLPFLVTFLQNRAHAPHFTISHLNGNLLFQALETLRQHDSAFSFKTLKTLTITHADRTRDIATPLLAFAPLFLPHLTSLCLDKINCGDAGAAAIAGSLHMAGLTSLSLKFTCIGDDGVTAIANSSYMAQLTSLHLECNLIEAAGVAAIANSSYMEQLTSLNLNHNETIGDAGAIAIANSAYMARLTSLDLYNTGIGDAGTIAITQSPHMARLTSWILGKDAIGVFAVMAIQDSLFLTEAVKQFVLGWRWKLFLDI